MADISDEDDKKRMIEKLKQIEKSFGYEGVKGIYVVLTTLFNEDNLKKFEYIGNLGISKEEKDKIIDSLMEFGKKSFRTGVEFGSYLVRIRIDKVIDEIFTKAP